MMALKEFLNRCEEIEPASMLLSRGRVGRKYYPFMHQQYLYWKCVLEPNIRLFIGDEIGLGKTIQACILLKNLILRGERKILILVPKVLKKQWYSELINFFPDYHVRILSSGKEIQTELSKSLQDYIIFLTSIDLAKREEYTRYFSGEWDVLIVDEAHNLGTDSLRNSLVSRIGAKHVIFLSATPHRGDDNKFIKMMSHIRPVSCPEETKDFLIRRTKRLVDRVKEILGYQPIFRHCKVCAVVSSATEDEKRFSLEFITYMRMILREHLNVMAIGLLTAIMRKRISSSPRAARKTIDSILVGKGREVDSKILERILEGSIEELSSALEEVEENEVDEVINAYVSSVAANLTSIEKNRLKEFLEILKRIEENDSKVAMLRRILQHHANDKVIIFTEYRDTLEYLREKLSDMFPLCIHGGMSERELYEIIQEFRDRGKILIATDVASEGLNLQFASILINYEPPWSPTKLEQRIGRIWRLGQKSDVIVYNLFLGTAADREVLEKLYGKVLNISRALEDVKNVLGEEVVGREISSIQEMITPGVSFSEQRAIMEQIRGKLDEFVKDIIEMIEKIKQKTSIVYDEENANVLAAIYQSLGIVGAKEADEAYEKLRDIARKLSTDKIIVPWDRDFFDVELVGIAKIRLSDVILGIPMIIGNQSFVAGSKILTVLRDCLENDYLIPDEIYKIPEPSKIVIDTCVTDFIKNIKKDAIIEDVEFERFFTIVRVSSVALESSKEYPREVGQKAEDIVRELEESKGRIVEERKTLGRYDFYSYEPSEAEKIEGSRDSERYIEVKGHGLGGLNVGLEESEYETAKILGKKYWLYVVWNVNSDSPIVACFRDPLSKNFFRIEEKEVEYICKKKRYFLKLKCL